MNSPEERRALVGQEAAKPVLEKAVSPDAEVDHCLSKTSFAPSLTPIESPETDARKSSLVDSNIVADDTRGRLASFSEQKLFFEDGQSWRQASRDASLHALSPKLEKTLVLLIGPPGSGKSTFGRWVQSHTDVEHVSTGDLIRQEIENGSEFGSRMKPYIDAGEIAPRDVVMPFLTQKLCQIDGGLMIDGTPRETTQIEDVEDIYRVRNDLDKNERLLVVALSLPKEVAKMRCTMRNEGRTDDSIEVFEKRWKFFEEKTLPVIAHYMKAGNEGSVIVSDASGTREDTESRVLQALEGYFNQIP